MHKESFILYLKKKSLFDKLPDAQAGQLVKAIFQFQTDGSRPADSMIDLLLEDFIVDFDKDGAKYASFVESRRKAALMRWNKHGEEVKETATEQKQTPPPTTPALLPTTSTLFGDATLTPVRKKKPAKNFVPPTVEEVRAYCESRNNGIDAQYFWEYNCARNWMYKGNVKMKDWKAAVRTWERNGGYSNVPPTPPTATPNQKTDIFTIMESIKNGNK